MNLSSDSESSPSSTHLQYSCGILSPSLYTKISLTISYTILLLAACVGNVLVIFLLRRYKSKAQMAFNHLIINMAVADIIEIFSSTALAVSFAFVGQQWIPGLLGNILCKMVPFVLIMSIYLSIWTLVIMSVDRYWAISHSLKKPMARPAVKRSIGLIWFLAAMAASPYLYKMRLKETGSTFECLSVWSYDPDIHLYFSKGEEVVKFVLAYIIPLTVIGTINIIIGRTLWSLKLTSNSKIQAKRDRRNRKIYKLLVSVVSLFAICWVFAHVNHLLSVFDMVVYCNLPAVIPFYFFWISHLNTAVNPIVYAVYNNRLRKGFRKLTRKSTKWSTSRRKNVKCEFLEENVPLEELEDKRA